MGHRTCEDMRYVGPSRTARARAISETGAPALVACTLHWSPAYWSLCALLRQSATDADSFFYGPSPFPISLIVLFFSFSPFYVVGGTNPRLADIPFWR